MMFCLLFLFLAMVLCDTPDLCSCPDRNCLPGYLQLGNGIDLYTGKTKTQILEMKCLESHTYSDALSNRTYYVFDNVEVVNGAVSKIEKFVAKTAYEYTKKQSESVHADIELGSWFSASIESSLIRQVQQKTETFVAFSSQMMSLWSQSLTLFPTMYNVTRGFQYGIDHLPRTYDKSKYMEVISQMGTHCIRKLKVGGLAKMVAFVDYEYLRDSTEMNVAQESSMQFSWMKSNVGGAQKCNSTTEQWKKDSYSEIVIQGGNPKYTRLDQWDQWLDTIDTLPVMLTYEVFPITMLIQDEQIRSNMKRAFVEYAVTVPSTKVMELTMWVKQDGSDVYTIKGGNISIEHKTFMYPTNIVFDMYGSQFDKIHIDQYRPIWDRYNPSKSYPFGLGVSLPQREKVVRTEFNCVVSRCPCDLSASLPNDDHISFWINDDCAHGDAIYEVHLKVVYID